MTIVQIINELYNLGVSVEGLSISSKGAKFKYDLRRINLKDVIYADQLTNKLNNHINEDIDAILSDCLVLDFYKEYSEELEKRIDSLVQSNEAYKKKIALSEKHIESCEYELKKIGEKHKKILNRYNELCSALGSFKKALFQEEVDRLEGLERELLNKLKEGYDEDL